MLYSKSELRTDFQIVSEKSELFLPWHRKTHKHSNEFPIISPYKYSGCFFFFLLLNLFFVSASHLFFTLSLSPALCLCSLCVSLRVFSQSLDFLVFFFSLGLPQAYPHQACLCLFLPLTAGLLCPLCLAFTICSSVLVFLQIALFLLELNFHFSSYSSATSLSLLIQISSYVCFLLWTYTDICFFLTLFGSYSAPSLKKLFSSLSDSTDVLPIYHPYSSIFFLIFLLSVLSSSQ